MADTFTQYNITMHPETKALSSDNSDIASHLKQINELHRALKTIPTGGIAPPPMPVPPQRSAAIEKLRNTGNAAFRKGNYGEAIKLYTHGLTMAATRPPWEPAPLLKDELQVLYANRAQAHMSMGNWPEALADACVSIDFKRQQNQKAHWRKGRCLKEMGRLEEAKEALEFGLEFEQQDGDLVGLLKEVNALLERKGRN